jgi:hypothetical protein
MADEQPTAAPTKRPRGRSPNYPGLDLETAIQRARTLYDRERTNVAHFDTIIRHWGYQAASGSARVTYAALRHYGLLTDEGSGDRKRARLSDLALRIVQDSRPNSPERQAALQEAALTPSIHREVWDDYQGALPSDDNLRYTLIRERGFTENGAEEFIREFRDTIAFAGLGEGATLPPQTETNQSGGSRQMQTQTLERPEAPPADPEARAVQLPLGGGKWATLHASFPVSEHDWDLMLAVLGAMKPGLVAEAPAAAPAPEEPQDDEQGT